MREPQAVAGQHAGCCSGVEHQSAIRQRDGRGRSLTPRAASRASHQRQECLARWRLSTTRLARPLRIISTDGRGAQVCGSGNAPGGAHQSEREQVGVVALEPREPGASLDETNHRDTRSGAEHLAATGVGADR